MRFSVLLENSEVSCDEDSDVTFLFRYSTEIDGQNNLLKAGEISRADVFLIH